MADRTIRIGKVSSVDYGSGMIKVTYPDLDNSVSKMYERLKRLYQEGRASEAMLKNAVKRGWITDEEMQEIIASKKEPEIPVSTPESR